MAEINPVIAQLTRGGIVESFHRGAFAVVEDNSKLIHSAGNINTPVFPRSAIKILQALPLLTSGAADAYRLTPQEIAVACASHNGETQHIDTVRSMLQKSGINETSLECGEHWPLLGAAARELATSGATPSAIHNNCSGKHAGMLATANYLGEELNGYVERKHTVQQRIEDLIALICECDLMAAPCGTDGCTVPTWAMPLQNMALGFAKISAGTAQTKAQIKAFAQIIASVRATPFMTAGSKRFCTNIMQAVPRLYAKVGAEGVYCGCIPHARLGIAVKCDDGATRAAEVIFAKIIAGLDVWENGERKILNQFSAIELTNCNDKIVGELRAITQ